MNNNKPKTTVECYLTACEHNSACCINPTGKSTDIYYCTKNNIRIDLDEDLDSNLNFNCVSFKSGEKDLKCLECLMEANDGEIPLDSDILDFEIEINDDDDDEIF